MKKELEGLKRDPEVSLIMKIILEASVSHRFAFLLVDLEHRDWMKAVGKIMDIFIIHIKTL